MHLILLLFTCVAASKNYELLCQEDEEISGRTNLTVSWLETQDWEGTSPRLAQALVLAQGTPTPLQLKQLEVDILVQFLTPNNLSSGKLAIFVNALRSTCYDSRNFHGVNLVKLLFKGKRKPETIFEEALRLIALCNVGQFPRHRSGISPKLLSSADNISPDSLAMTIIALSCGSKLRHHAYLHDYMTSAMRRLKTLTNNFTSFSDNVYTSALIAQALAASGKRHHLPAFRYYLSHVLDKQRLDGSFENSLATYLALPALRGRSLASIHSVECDLIVPEHESYSRAVVGSCDNNTGGDPLNFSVQSLAANISTTVYFDQTLPISVLDAMATVLECLPDDFRYELKDYGELGPMVTSINGIPNNGSSYWRLGVSRDRADIELSSGLLTQVLPEDSITFVYQEPTYLL